MTLPFDYARMRRAYAHAIRWIFEHNHWASRMPQLQTARTGAA